jgi:hypothetical protein
MNAEQLTYVQSSDPRLPHYRQIVYVTSSEVELFEGACCRSNVDVQDLQLVEADSSWRTASTVHLVLMLAQPLVQLLQPGGGAGPAEQRGGARPPLW